MAAARLVATPKSQSERNESDYAVRERGSQGGGRGMLT
jgi:hypothetical protein